MRCCREEGKRIKTLSADRREYMSKNGIEDGLVLKKWTEVVRESRLRGETEKSWRVPIMRILIVNEIHVLRGIEMANVILEEG